jgi:threonine aldolase
MLNETTKEEILAGCTRFLTGHPRKTPRQVLMGLAESVNDDVKPDRYGRGAIIEDFERQIAGLLGKESAVFMPSGTMAQQIALRLWAERRHSIHVAFHPTCHLEIHEHKGYQLLHGLHGILVGNPNRLMTLDDLKGVREPLAALLIELPQREIGGQLPSWDELVELTGWAREQDIPLHMDGARLWECKPFYRREYHEITGLFDSVYVSFYKGLGGIAGAVLAGPDDLIQPARTWQRRHGGNLIYLYPYILSAQLGLTQRLEHMQAYHDKALELAQILSEFPQVTIVPNPPHTNMMHAYIHGDRERLDEAALHVAAEAKTLLFPAVNPSPVPDLYKVELSVGDATLDLSAGEIRSLFQMLLEQAESEEALSDN